MKQDNEVIGGKYEKTVITRNFDAKAKMTAQGLTEGNVYRVYKMQVKEGEAFDACSVAWVYLEDGTLVEVFHAHVILEEV